MTVPDVSKLALAVLAVARVPVAATVAVTVPCATVTVREPDDAFVVVVPVSRTSRIDQPTAPSASTARARLTRRLGTRRTPHVYRP
ncbi:hypothetical protein [Paractinoplanes durhamensis]|uniref:hypothetical protein n=1 Tax=Paractinoplanes durhamensis TaxID=113563 RepID=UPI0036356E07